MRRKMLFSRTVVPHIGCWHRRHRISGLLQTLAGVASSCGRTACCSYDAKRYVVTNLLYRKDNKRQ